MNQTLLSTAVKFLGITLITFAASNALGQSTARQNEHQAQPQAIKLGLEGYCPVCIVGMKKWVKGSPDHQTVYDGATYQFPDADTKTKFDANPVAYVPALGGDCTVCYAKMGKRAPGNIRIASLYNKRVFLFPEQKQKEMFDAAPAEYANVDLAADGNCIVCLVKMNKEVPGKAEFTAVHNGMRYLFPSDSERQMFIAAPTDFVPASAAKMEGESKTMQASTQTQVSITGKTGCAACSYGVKPIGAPNELGLAVVDQAGKIYVIEESHTRWPELYKARFDGKQVRVSGEIIRSEGNVAWVKPTELSTL
jgi:YHS domain-containing protein